MAGPTLAWVWAACRKHSLQPVTVDWLSQVLNISVELARGYIFELKRYGCLVREGGADGKGDGLGVRYRVVLTSTLPGDSRGLHWEAKRAALNAGGGLAKPSRDRRSKTGAARAAAQMRKRKRLARTSRKPKPCEPG